MTRKARRNITEESDVDQPRQLSWEIHYKYIHTKEYEEISFEFSTSNFVLPKTLGS